MNPEQNEQELEGVDDAQQPKQQDDDPSFDFGTSGNETIDRYIDESIQAQDEVKKQDEQRASNKEPDPKSGEKKPNGDAVEGRDQAVAADQGTGDKNTGDQQGRKSGEGGPPGGLADDGKGNLVNAEGKIVAKAGSERRYYETAQRLSTAMEHAQKHIKAIEGDLVAAKQDLATNNYLNGMPTQLGLNQNEVQTGLQLISQWKSNPQAAVKFILTEYAAMGYNVNELLGKDGGIDMSAIRSMIDQAVSPLQSDRASQQAQNEALAQAERDYNSFMAKYPEARTHENEIATLMKKDASVSPEVALFQLKSWALENGLDFTQPLGPQYQAKLQGVSHSEPLDQGRQSTHNGEQQKPMMNGKSGSGTQMQQHQSVARADADWDDIIKEEMQRSGL